MKKIIITCACILAVVAGCVVWWLSSSREIELTNEITNCISSEKLMLSSLNVGKEWDTMYIIDPYDRDIESLHISIDNTSRREIIRHSVVEGECTMVFVLENKLTAYCFVGRKIFDLTKAEKKVYNRKEIIKLQK